MSHPLWKGADAVGVVAITINVVTAGMLRTCGNVVQRGMVWNCLELLFVVRFPEKVNVFNVINDF